MGKRAYYALKDSTSKGLVQLRIGSDANYEPILRELVKRWMER